MHSENITTTYPYVPTNDHLLSRWDETEGFTSEKCENVTWAKRWILLCWGQPLLARWVCQLVCLRLCPWGTNNFPAFQHMCCCNLSFGAALSETQAVLGRVIPGGWVPVSGMKMRSLVGSSAHSAFHRWSAHCAARMLLLSDKLMSCCAAGTNGCLDLRRHAFALDGRVSAKWSRCPGSVARRPRDCVAPLQRSSAGWMPARIGRLSAGVGRRHPVTIRKESLMVESIRRVWTSCYVNQQEKLGFGKFEFWEVFCEIRHNR